eukprot:jgi/Bigna1/139527/aug1.51_g14235
MGMLRTIPGHSQIHASKGDAFMMRRDETPVWEKPQTSYEWYIFLYLAYHLEAWIMRQHAYSWVSERTGYSLEGQLRVIASTKFQLYCIVFLCLVWYLLF